MNKAVFFSLRCRYYCAGKKIAGCALCEGRFICWLQKILLPSARHLEEGRGTTKAGKLHERVVPQPPWEPPTPSTQIG